MAVDGGGRRPCALFESVRLTVDRPRPRVPGERAAAAEGSRRA
jgi:hypothetical protein